MPNHCDEIPLLRTVREVVDILGGTNATAERIGVSPPAVSWWLSNGCFPPARYLDIRGALEAVGRDVDPALFRKVSDTGEGEADAA
jgi:DNA-binding transcriptional regulator YdaS (Cro superfamily)